MEISPSVHLECFPRSSLLSLVLECLEKQEFKSLQRLDVSPGCTSGDNYIGVLFRVEAEGITSSGAPIVMHLIVKCSPDNKIRREFFDAPLMFLNEGNFYRHVVPALDFKSVPQCYEILRNDHDDAIILEDMKPAGFNMLPRAVGLPVENARHVLIGLARLHAASFALRMEKPENFEEIVPLIKDLLFDEDRRDNFEDFLQTCIANMLSMVLEYFKQDKENEYVKAVERLADGGYNLVSEIVRETLENEKVINHGDCWTNNLLFRSSENGEIDQVIFIDFQLSRITSPAVDVTFFLFSSLQPDKLIDHYDSLLDCYHEALTSELKDRDLEVTFTRDRLNEEMARCAPYGLAMAGVLAPTIHCPPEFSPNLDNIKGNSEQEFIIEYSKVMRAITPECRHHLATVIKHCVDRGYF